MNVHVVTPTQARLAAEHKARQRRLGLIKTASEKEAEKRAEQERRSHDALAAWNRRIQKQKEDRKKLWRISWRTMVALAMKKQERAERAKQRAAKAADGSVNGAFAYVLEDVALKYDVTVADIKGPARTPLKLVQARFEAFWIGNKRNKIPFTVLGRIVGGRDHTTVLSAVRRYEAMRQYVLTGAPVYSMKGRNSLVISDLVITGE